MDINSIHEFISLVKTMREAQRKAKRTYLDADIAEQRKLEAKVDKVIRDHDNQVFVEELGETNSLFS